MLKLFSRAAIGGLCLGALAACGDDDAGRAGKAAYVKSCVERLKKAPSTKVDTPTYCGCIYDAVTGSAKISDADKKLFTAFTKGGTLPSKEGRAVIIKHVLKCSAAKS